MIKAPDSGIHRIASWISLLSFDVVAGAVAMAWLFNRVAGTTLPSCYWFVLAMAVWSVYTSDHLFDAFRGKPGSLAPRHRIHLQYRTILLTLTIGAGISAAILALWCLDSTLLLAGFILAIVTGAYLLAIRAGWDRKSRWFQKEAIIALIYSTGIWLVPISKGVVFIAGPGLLAVATLLTVYANLVMNSWFEYREDLASSFNSLAVQFGRQTANRVGVITILVAALLCVIILRSTNELNFVYACLSLLIIQAGLVLLSAGYRWSSQHMRYRLIGDLLYATPLVLWLLSI